MQTFMFKPGDVLNYPGFTAGFESNINTAVKFFRKDGQFMMTSSEPIGETTMATQETVTFPAGDTIPAKRCFYMGLAITGF